MGDLVEELGLAYDNVRAAYGFPKRSREPKNEKTLIGGAHKHLDQGFAVAQQARDRVGPGVAHREPHDLGRRPPQDTQLSEVVVLGDDDEAVLARMFPDIRVGLPVQPHGVDV